VRTASVAALFLATTLILGKVVSMLAGVSYESVTFAVGAGMAVGMVIGALIVIYPEEPQ